MISFHCVKCKTQLREGAAFCPECGHKVGEAVPQTISERREKIKAKLDAEWTIIKRLILFYVGLVAATVAFGFALVHTDDVVLTFIIGDLVIAFYVVVVALFHLDVIAPLVTFVKGMGRWWVWMAWGAPLLFLGMHYTIAALEYFFSIQSEQYLADFEGVSIWYAVFTICVMPAIFEELSFRGIIYSRLAKMVPGWEAVMISSVAFGILHFSVISLFTHTVMGLWFCFLRIKSKSLLLPIAAHFIHNLLVILNEKYGWIGGFGG